MSVPNDNPSGNVLGIKAMLKPGEGFPFDEVEAEAKWLTIEDLKVAWAKLNKLGRTY